MGSGNLGCGASLAKIILFIFNFCFWLSGAALLAVGIWARVDSESLSEKLEEFLKISNQDNNFNNVAYLFIVVGAFIFVVGFCGCCGAIKESRCLLGIYITLLVIVMLCEIGAVIAVAVFRKDIEEGLQDGGSKYIKEKYGSKTDGNEAIDQTWNLVMGELKCCGMTGAKDFRNSTFQDDNSPLDVPDFCCKLEKYNETQAFPTDRTKCRAEAKACLTRDTGCDTAEHFINKGCYDAGKDFVSKHAVIFIGVGAGLGALELFGMLFAVCLCRAIGDDDKY